MAGDGLGRHTSRPAPPWGGSGSLRLLVPWVVHGRVRVGLVARTRLADGVALCQPTEACCQAGEQHEQHEAGVREYGLAAIWRRTDEDQRCQEAEYRGWRPEDLLAPLSGRLQVYAPRVEQQDAEDDQRNTESGHLASPSW